MDPAAPPSNPTSSTPTLATKIARLVEERGWNQEEFARIADLNRQTVRQILQEGDRKLRNTTVLACARALGLPVSDLRTLPLERLLARINGQAPLPPDDPVRVLYEKATSPQLLAWIERNQERARQLSREEADELLSIPDETLNGIGVAHFIEVIERKRKLIEQVHAIAGTEYLDLLEKLVALMYDKIQPYRDRA
jgi:transcriptional regulator with XRE-family HTH domain